MNRHFEIISHKFNNLKQEIMKKYFLTMATVALFAIGFAASDEEESSSSESSTPQTEQKQETEAERKAREQKEEAERQAREQKEAADKMEKLRKEVADAGYKKGYEQGWQGSMPLVGEEEIYYKHKFGVPTSNEEKELFQLYKQKYREGYKEGQASR